MEDQTRFGRARTGRCVTAVTGAVALLALVACSEPWQTTRAVRPDERAHQTYCAVKRDTEPQGRVINYVDPELCGRYVRDRSDYQVRVPPIARPSGERRY